MCRLIKMKCFRYFNAQYPLWKTLSFVGLFVILIYFIRQLTSESSDTEYVPFEQDNGRWPVRSQSALNDIDRAENGVHSGGYMDDVIVIYNRVPKTGSTSFVGLAYDLYGANRFHIAHVNVTKNSHILSTVDQMRFANNLTRWNAMKPCLYHGHMAYVDFSKFGISSKPLYINIIREPLDRLVSYYYFVRYGDNFRPHLKRRKAGNRETFDDCVARQGADCEPDHLWLQIPFFCGQAAQCWIPGNQWALEMAKFNLVNNYLLVGVTEHMGDFIAVIEALLPRFFSGALDLYNSGNKSHLRKTFNKSKPSEETIARIRLSEVWRMEQEFYDFVKDQFFLPLET